MGLKKYQQYINGAFEDPASGEWIESFNPYTAEPWALIPRGNAGDASRAVEAAERAFNGSAWRGLTASQRGKLLCTLGELAAEQAESLARFEVLDSGKLINEMVGQLRYVPEWYHYYGGLADKIEGRVTPSDKPNTFSFTRHEPLGVVAAITPWNSPLLITAWKLAPALAAGNTVVLKPSEHASASTLEFVKLVEKAGFPPGVVNVVTGYGNEAGEPLVTDSRVAKVSFTGGDVTGQRVYELAAKDVKKVTMELGGKSPNIVFEDASIDNAVKGVVAGIFAATGQTCIAGSRLLLQESIYEEFVDKLIAFAKTARMGDPLSEETQMGPVSTKPQYEKVLSYMQVAKEEGATCVLGGSRANRPECGKGWFVEPTIYTGVQNNMRIAREEIFGPVLSVIPFRDEEEAIQIANDTPYGLAAGLWTNSTKRALTVSERLRAGTVWVNTYRSVSYLSPFGGYKRSGLGRESGKEAIYDYLQTKCIWIDTAEEFPNPFVMR